MSYGSGLGYSEGCQLLARQSKEGSYLGSLFKAGEEGVGGLFGETKDAWESLMETCQLVS